MPPTTTKGSLNLGASLKTHAKDKTEEKQEFVNLPAGISGGVAHLVEAKLGVYKTGNNAGEKFVYLSGTVVEPKTATEIKKVFKDGKVQVISTREIRVEGARTSIMLPLCDVKRKNGDIVTSDENIAKMLNELRLLGGAECTESVESEEDLVGLLDQLKETSLEDGSQIYFKFGTSGSDPTKEYPEPTVWENWYGTKGLETYAQEFDRGTEDNTKTTAAPAKTATTAAGPKTSTNGAAPAKTAPATKPAAKKPEPKAVDPDELDQSDIDSLNTRANDADQRAQARLKELAMEVGHTEEECDETQTWDELADLVRNPKTEGGEENAGEQGEWKPAKEEVYEFFPVDPKTKKKVKKAIEVEVMSVDEKAQTVKIKSLTDGKTTWTVKWDELTTPS